MSEEEEVYSYRVTATVDEALQFYETELPKAGWNRLGQGLMEGGGFLLMYEKEGVGIIVAIGTAKAGGTGVVIGRPGS